MGQGKRRDPGNEVPLDFIKKYFDYQIRRRKAIEPSSSKRKAVYSRVFRRLAFE